MEDKWLKEKNKLNYEGKIERDYLPFANKTLYFAERLENAPKKPKFVVKINPNKFVSLFQEYARDIQHEFLNTKLLEQDDSM